MVPQVDEDDDAVSVEVLTEADAFLDKTITALVSDLTFGRDMAAALHEFSAYMKCLEFLNKLQVDIIQLSPAVFKSSNKLIKDRYRNLKIDMAIVVKGAKVFKPDPTEQNKAMKTQFDAGVARSRKCFTSERVRTIVFLVFVESYFGKNVYSSILMYLSLMSFAQTIYELQLASILTASQVIFLSYLSNFLIIIIFLGLVVVTSLGTC